MGCSPLSSATKKKFFESGDQVKPFTQASKSGVRFVIAPEARSYFTSRKRSLSYPARSCMRQAINFPSGEYWGELSLPGLELIFFAAPPAMGTSQMSLFVLIASTGSWLLV